MRASITAEKTGIPAVSVVISDYIPLAKHTARGEGISGIRIAEYPGSIYTHSDNQISQVIEQKVANQIVNQLTSPVKETITSESEPVSERIAFSGDLEQVNEFYYRKGWTDGLPIIPPTADKIKQFLEYTDLPPDHQIAALPLSYHKATPWNIAVNGVMAGCRPEYMPVLIAAVEAIADPEFRLKDIGNTCGCRPYLLINGPIRKRLDFYSGTGLISPGARRPGSATGANPNSTIGRALHLIIQNIAGFRPGETEMGVFGHPQSFVIAENEEDSPWEAYHIEHGFDPDKSTVTALSWMGTIGPESETKGNTSGPHLKSMGQELRHGMHPIAYRFGERLMVSVLMVPPVAKVIAADGLSKRAAAEQIVEYSRTTIKEINERLQAETYDVHHFVEEGGLQPSFDLGSNEQIPAVVNSDLIHILVCGSAERNRTLMLFSFYGRPVTREIKLASKH